MTDAIAKYEPAAIARWSDMDDARKRLLREVCSGSNLTDSQFELLCEVAVRTGLDPMQRQIYGLVVDGKFMVHTGIHGLTAIAERTGAYAGFDDPIFTKDAEGQLKCTVTVYKLVQGQRCPFTASAYFREFARRKKDGALMRMWQQMPTHQLAKCTRACALRLAFPSQLGDLYETAELPVQSGGRIVQHAVKQVGTAAQLLAPAQAEPDGHDGDAPADDDEYDDDRDPRDKDAP